MTFESIDWEDDWTPEEESDEEEPEKPVYNGPRFGITESGGYRSF